jgi:hypothetical protein
MNFFQRIGKSPIAKHFQSNRVKNIAVLEELAEQPNYNRYDREDCCGRH